MSKQREALKLALEALTDFDYDKRQAAIAKVREVLTQPIDTVQEAAPDLLKELENMMDRAHPAYVGNDFMRRKLIAARETARAAIAKAKGEL